MTECISPVSLVLFSINTTFYKTKTVKDMTEMFEVRKVLTQGQDHLSHSVVIPHKFLADMKITKGDYLKIHTNGSMIMMEKLIQDDKNHRRGII